MRPSGILRALFIIGMIAPARTKSGMRSSRAAASTVAGPVYLRPVQ